MKNYHFYSTRPLVGPYEFIVKSCVKNFQKDFKNSIKISIFKPKRLLDLRLKNPLFNNLRILLNKAIPRNNRKKVKF